MWPAARAIVRTACRVIFQGPNAVMRTTTVHGEDLGAFVVGGEGGGGLLSPSLFAGCEGIVGSCNLRTSSAFIWDSITGPRGGAQMVR